MYSVPEHIFEISRALGEETRFRIFSHIAEAEKPVTVKELVDGFGMHHSAIRIHLNKLQEAGLIVAGQEHDRGAVGRPRLVFSPTSDLHAVSLPPRSYALLADVVLEHTERADGSGLREFALDWGRSQARRTRVSPNGGLSIPEALDLVPDELGRCHGFSVASANGNGGYVITGRNCPFLELARRHDPIVCEMHQNMVRGMVEELSGTPLEWNHSSRQIDSDSETVPGECRVEIEPISQA